MKVSIYIKAERGPVQVGAQVELDGSLIKRMRKINLPNPEFASKTYEIEDIEEHEDGSCSCFCKESE